jgi:uncharacterized membrane protein (UPF0182 family)
VIDAYDGSIKAYLVDTDDPLIAAWNRIFPDLFTPFSGMPQEFKAISAIPKTVQYSVTDSAALPCY